MNKKNWLIIGLVILVAFGIYSQVDFGPKYPHTQLNEENEIIIQDEEECPEGSEDACCNQPMDFFDDDMNEIYSPEYCTQAEGGPCSSYWACINCLIRAMEACRVEYPTRWFQCGVMTYRGNHRTCWTNFGESDNSQKEGQIQIFEKI